MIFIYLPCLTTDTFAIEQVNDNINKTILSKYITNLQDCNIPMIVPGLLQVLLRSVLPVPSTQLGIRTYSDVQGTLFDTKHFLQAGKRFYELSVAIDQHRITLGLFFQNTRVLIIDRKSLEHHNYQGKIKLQTNFEWEIYFLFPVLNLFLVFLLTTVLYIIFFIL